MKHTGRGLVVKAPWVDLILSGKKTWEIRGARTNIRGKIDLIQSGTGLIYGSADLVECEGPLRTRTLNDNKDKHCIPTTFFDPDLSFFQIPETNNEAYMPYKKTYAWVLQNAKRFKKPVPYKHPMGAIIWVKL